jgi:hypothetical protein
MAGLFSEDMDLKLASLMLILLLIFTLVRDSRIRAQCPVPRAPQPYPSQVALFAHFVRQRPTVQCLACSLAGV